MTSSRAIHTALSSSIRYQNLQTFNSSQQGSGLRPASHICFRTLLQRYQSRPICCHQRSQSSNCIHSYYQGYLQQSEYEANLLKTVSRHTRRRHVQLSQLQYHPTTQTKLRPNSSISMNIYALCLATSILNVPSPSPLENQVT